MTDQQRTGEWISGVLNTLSKGCFICSVEVCGRGSGRCCTVCGTSGFSCVVFVVLCL